MSERNLHRAPAHLEKSGRAFWAKIVKDYLLEAHHLELLSLACECLDRIDQARTVLAEEGAFVTNRFNERTEHPAARMERAQKTLFVRIIRDLGLEIATEESRPPRTY